MPCFDNGEFARDRAVICYMSDKLRRWRHVLSAGTMAAISVKICAELWVDDVRLVAMANDDKTDMEQALDASENLRPGRFPRALPLTHIGKTAQLHSILSSNGLKPVFCNIMRNRIVYLFYGGLFYRSQTTPTKEEDAYPIGFLFHPSIVEESDTFFPFDTGAISAGAYKTKPCRSYKKTYRVSYSNLTTATDPTHVPRLLVKHLFKSNKNYRSGRPDTNAVNKPAPIADLLRFILGENDDSDHRRSCIESHRKIPLPFNEKLLWLGYPETFEDEVQELLRKLDPHVPITCSYEPQVRFRPSDLCARLDESALRDVFETFLR